MRCILQLHMAALTARIFCISISAAYLTTKLATATTSVLPACRLETGACYAIDIGGTNFRVVYYKLSEKRGLIVSCETPL